MTDSTHVVRRIFDEVVNHGKLEAVDELFDAEFQTVTPQGALDREGFKEYVRQWRAGFPDVYCELDDFVVQGDRVAWAVRATGTHTGDFMGIPPTGSTVEFDSLNIAELRDGRLYRHRVMMDIAKLMGQLGVGGQG
jgi:predicted ester cyclase